MEQNDQIRERARDLRQASTHPRHSRGARLQGLGTSCTWCSSKCEEQCFSKGCGKQAHRSCWQDASSELALLGPAIVLCPECAVKAIDGSLDRTHVRDHVHTLQEMKIRCYQVNVRPCHSSGTSSSWTSSGDGRVSASKSERQQSALCSAYPQPILSLPSAYPLILSHPARGDGGGGDAAAGELGGEFARGLSTAPGGLPCRFRRRRRRPSLPAAYHQPTLSLPSNPAWSPRCAAAACNQGHCSEHREHRGSEASGSASQAKPAASSQAKPWAAPPGAAGPPEAGAGPKQPQSSALSSTGRGGKRGREETTQGAATAAPGPPAKVCPVRASALGALCSAYPQPILSLPSAYPLILPGRLVALLLLAIRVIAPSTASTEEARLQAVRHRRSQRRHRRPSRGRHRQGRQHRQGQGQGKAQERRPQDLRPRYALCERQHLCAAYSLA